MRCACSSCLVEQLAFDFLTSLARKGFRHSFRSLSRPYPYPLLLSNAHFSMPFSGTENSTFATHTARFCTSRLCLAQSLVLTFWLECILRMRHVLRSSIIVPCYGCHHMYSVISSTPLYSSRYNRNWRAQAQRSSKTHPGLLND